MSIIQVQNLTFAYEGSYDNIFENVSFLLDTDWKLGFTGRNGRGKTTFLNLLMGKYKYRGSINSSEKFDYFPFKISDENKNTIDVVNEVCPDFEHWRICRELSLVETDEKLLYRPFKTLTGGEKTKVLLASLFQKDNNFLLIDEPTNHLDMHAREVLSKYLSAKKGFILVSHDRVFLDKTVDHILSINKTNIEVQKGNFSSWFYNKELLDNYETEQNSRLKKEIGRLKESAKRTSQWSQKTENSKIGTHTADRGFVGHKAAKLMKLSKNAEERLNRAADEKSRLLKNIETAEDLKITTLNHPKELLVEARDLAVYYGGTPVFDNLSFNVKRGDITALSGKNGSGKSSILKLILGEKIKYTGTLNITSNLKISYVSQDTSGLSGNLSDYAANKDIDESLFKTILRKLDFERIQFEKDITDFSEGQKKKVLIAASLSTPAHLYIWDEPLNFIDVLSRIQIEELIVKYNPTLLFVEHDAMFTKNTAKKTIALF